MNKIILNIVVAVSVAVAVVGVGLAMKLSSQKKMAEAVIASLHEQISRMEAPASNAGSPVESRDIDGSTNEIEALQAVLAEKEAELAVLKTNTAPPDVPPQQRESWEDRMARMKEEDPEGYAEMIQRREERQQEMRYNLAERTATFMDLDTSRMTEEELANHELLVEKMARIWELTNQFEDPEAAPNREAMRELYREIREARPLMEQERTVILRQLGSDLGYEGKDAQDFASHVEDIISATTIQTPRGGRGGRGGGR